MGRLILKLSLPALAAKLINALYNMVDRAYIAHMPESGHLALTGLGLSFSIIRLIAAFRVLIGMGGAPLAAIKMGAGNHKAAEKILGNCFAAPICVPVGPAKISLPLSMLHRAAA